MKSLLAIYILELHKASLATKRAEDRPSYEKYLAYAAVILALTETGAAREIIQTEMDDHERLWGHIWLVDDVRKKPSDAWQKVKKAMQHESDRST